MATFFLLTIFLAYVSLGLPDSALGVVWPNARPDFGASQDYAGYYTVVVTLCAMLSAVLSVKAVKRLGAGRIVAFSGLLTGSGILLFGILPLKELLFIPSVLLGFGAGAVDAVLNNYVAERYSSKIMSWLHACWGIGASIGPLIITAWIERGNWRAAFYTLGGIQLALAILFFCTLFLWKKDFRKSSSDAEQLPVPARPDYTMKNLAPWLCVIIFFIYVGIENTCGTWLKTLLYVDRGVDNTLAGVAVSVYYGSITGGRILFGLVAKRLGNRRSVIIGVISALCGACLLFVNVYPVSVAAVFLIGLGFAPIYPSMMHETARRFNRDTTTKTISFQLAAANAGAMIFTPVIGKIGAAFNMSVLIWCAIGGTALILALNTVLNKLTSYRKPTDGNGSDGAESAENTDGYSDTETTENTDGSELTRTGYAAVIKTASAADEA
ncbi:MAG: MFS transporter [Clostridiaceae bacterium]|jgi:MFS family permease|nr:MFS transporter [Clostridiaceae bacterium]